MRLTKSLAAKGESFLDRMRVNHPTAYAIAENMVHGEMNDSAEVNIKSFIMIGFGAIIVSAFIPMGINALATAETANFSTTELALYSVIGVAILIAVVMMFVNLAS